MSKADLKAAMDLLQVNQPLRLQRPAPAFIPPANDSVDTTPVGNTTLVQNPTPVTNVTPVEKLTQVDITTPVGIQTQVTNSTQVENPTPVAKATQVTDESTVIENDSVTLTRRATEQDSSVVMEARAADGLERGYTRIPNCVLMKLASGDFTRNEIKLALLVARFTISFQRKLAPLSKMVLERRSGLRGAAVLEALSGLVAKGLIQKQQGDQHRPNMLGLVLPADWEVLTKPKREIEPTPVGNQTLVVNPTQVGNLTPVENPTPVINPSTAPVGKATPAGVGNPTYFKDIKRYQNNFLSELPAPLQEYFEELMPAKKREAEWQALESLRGDYPAKAISDCLDYIQTKGIGEGKRPCHSPMAYLAKAMGGVLPQAQAWKQKQIEAPSIQTDGRSAKTAAQKAIEDAKEDAETSKRLAQAEAALAANYPDNSAQDSTLRNHLPISGGCLRSGALSPVFRRIALLRWFDSLSTSKNKNSTNEVQNA